jgi:integrase
MSLYRQPKSPYWWVRFSIGGRKTRRSTQTTDRAAAEEFESKLRADLWRQIKLGERPRYTFTEAVEHWYELADNRSRDQDRAKLKWFATYIGGLPLAELTRERIEKLRAVRCAESSPSTANRYMALLRMILRKAEREWGWLERAPVVPMYAQERHEPRFLTRAQFTRLKRELPPHLAALAEFSVQTGLRMRNATHLTWAQVDLRRKQLMIPAARAKAGETIAIPLSPRAVTILRAQRGKHPERVFTYKRQGKKNGDRVPIEHVPLDDANGAAFRKACKRAKLPWLRWHDLRHTWASWAIQRGVPPHVLQELGGWKSEAMVRRYGHLTVEHLRPWVERKNGIPARRRRAA